MPCAIATGCGAHVVVVVRMTLRTRFTLRTGAWRAILRAFTFFLALCTLTCAGGWSAICTAPPPISAPPHVHAHSFAKAIRTDIIPDLFSRFGGAPSPVDGIPPFTDPIGQNSPRAANILTLFTPLRQNKSHIIRCKKAKRPVVERLHRARVNPIRSYSPIRAKISTDESAMLDLRLVWPFARVYSARQERECGLSRLHSGRIPVENSQ